MTDTRNETRKGGRPRQFENEDAFRAATRALMRVGYARLTLEAVAREAGCSAPALSKRFGSKRELIEAYLEWSIEAIHERFRTARLNHTSPLAALRARYLRPDERPEESGPFTRWSDVLSDPDLAPTVWRLRRVWEEEAAASLGEAQAVGELIDCDVEELARTLVASLVGATVLWSPDHEAISDRIATVFDTIIDRFRTEETES